jgi:hypothetical protein
MATKCSSKSRRDQRACKQWTFPKYKGILFTLLRIFVCVKNKGTQQKACVPFSFILTRLSPRTVRWKSDWRYEWLYSVFWFISMIGNLKNLIFTISDFPPHHLTTSFKKKILKYLTSWRSQTKHRNIQTTRFASTDIPEQWAKDFTNAFEPIKCIRMVIEPEKLVVHWLINT